MSIGEIAFIQPHIFVILLIHYLFGFFSARIDRALRLLDAFRQGSSGAGDRRQSRCESTDPEFSRKAADVVGLYLNPPQNGLVLCVDEKPCI
jgi:hypothetical protein